MSILLRTNQSCT